MCDRCEADTDAPENLWKITVFDVLEDDVDERHLPHLGTPELAPIPGTDRLASALTLCGMYCAAHGLSMAVDKSISDMAGAVVVYGVTLPEDTDITEPEHTAWLPEGTVRRVLAIVHRQRVDPVAYVDKLRTEELEAQFQ